MPLNDMAVRNAKPGEKDRKLADARGLYLLVTTNGSKLWRVKFRVAGKEKKLALGAYPDVSLRDARARCDDARRSLAAGDDPAALKRKQKQAAKLNAATSFEVVANEYITKREREGLAAPTVEKSRWLLSLMKSDIGSLPIAEITPADLLATLQKRERRGNLDTAKRMRAFAGRVFRYAVATGRAADDPAAVLRGALTAPVVKHHGAITDPKAVGALLRAIDGYEGQPVTQYALLLAPHVFVRPGELRRAEWSEIDLAGAVWTIPAEKMKTRQPHTVPLSQQAVVVLNALSEIAGEGRYLFPSIRTAAKPMSENTINAALRRLGYGGDEMTGHGFRAMASTLLNESGKWHPDAIERALAHKDADPVRASYHRGAHWSERVQMAQWWSDYLDVLRDGAAVLPFMREARK